MISETSKICTQTLPSKCSEPLESEEAGAFSPYLIFKEHEISAFSGSRIERSSKSCRVYPKKGNTLGPSGACSKVGATRNRPPYVSNNELDIPQQQITCPHFKARRNKAFENPCNFSRDGDGPGTCSCGRSHPNHGSSHWGRFPGFDHLSPSAAFAGVFV